MILWVSLDALLCGHAGTRPYRRSRGGSSSKTRPVIITNDQGSVATPYSSCEVYEYVYSLPVPAGQLKTKRLPHEPNK